MKTTSRISNTMQQVITAVCFAAAALATTSIAGADEFGKCAFSLQLHDPTMRADYLNAVDIYKNGARPRYANGVEEMYANVTPVSFTHDPGWADVDSVSFECVTCHDGMSAKSHDVRIKNNPMERGVGLDSVIGSHPIGMHYESYAATSREFKSPDRLDRNMVFVNGTMGCITCHNPLNPKKQHLVMDNSRSKLCFECHDK